MNQVKSVVRPKNRRELILRAAAELFHQRGYHAVGLADIGEAVGVSAMAIYRHYDSKEGLLQACLDQSLQVLRDAIRRTDSEDILDLVSAITNAVIDNWNLATVFQREARSLDRDRLSEIVLSQQAVRREVVPAIKANIPGLTGADLQLRLQAVIGMICALCVNSAGAESRTMRRKIAANSASVLMLDTVPPIAARGRSAASPTAFARASKRELILGAAIQRFASKGFRAVSVEDIGADAGVSGPAVYYHFPNKEAMLAVAARRAGELLASDISAQLAAHPDGNGLLAALVRSFVRRLDEHRRLFVVFFNDASNLSGSDLECQEQYLALLQEEWAFALRAVRPELSAREALRLVLAAIGALLHIAVTPEIWVGDLEDYDMTAALEVIALHILTGNPC